MNRIEKREFLLNEPLNKIALKLCFPAVISMVFVGLNGFMDGVYVSWLVDKNSLAGVSMGAIIVQIFIGIGSLIGVGAGTVVSVAIGEKNYLKIKGIVANILVLSIVFSLILFPLLWYFSSSLIVYMGAKDQILQSGIIYLHTSLYGIFFYTYGLALNMMIRGEGRIKEATYITVIGLSINMILTPLFIEVYHMGVAGAAWGTNLAMAVYIVLSYNFLRKKNLSFEVDLFKIYFVKQTIKEILNKGLPLVIMSVFTIIQMYIIFNVISYYGDDKDMVFYSAVMRILALLIMPYMGLMFVSQAVSGVNYGAKNYLKIKEIYWYFTKIGIYLVTPFWLVIILFPDFVLGMVLPNFRFDDMNILDFRVFMAILPILSVNYIALSILPVIKKDKIASLIAISRQLFLFIPVMFVLPIFIGVDGVYFGTAMIDLFISIWVLITMNKVFKEIT